MGIPARDNSDPKSNHTSRESMECTSQTFLTRPSKDGRISIPNLIISNPNQNLQGHVMRVTLQPI